MTDKRKRGLDPDASQTEEKPIIADPRLAYRLIRHLVETSNSTGKQWLLSLPHDTFKGEPEPLPQLFSKAVALAADHTRSFADLETFLNACGLDDQNWEFVVDELHHGIGDIPDEDSFFICLEQYLGYCSNRVRDECEQKVRAAGNLAEMQEMLAESTEKLHAIQQFIDRKGASRDDILEGPAETLRAVLTEHRLREGLTYIPTGLKEIDSRMEGGLPRGTLGILSTDTGGGKTLLAQYLARHTASLVDEKTSSTFRVLYLSYEISTLNLLLRDIPAIMGEEGITTAKLMNRQLQKEDDWDRIIDAAVDWHEGTEDEHGNMRIIRIAPDDNSIEEVERLAAKYMPDMLIIDHGMRLDCGDGQEHTMLKRHTSRLDKLAQRTECVIVYLAQRNKEGELAFSSAVDQAASWHITWDPQKDDNWHGVDQSMEFPKNRYGQAGGHAKVHFRWDLTAAYNPSSAPPNAAITVTRDKEEEEAADAGEEQEVKAKAKRPKIKPGAGARFIRQKRGE